MKNAIPYFLNLFQGPASRGCKIYFDFNRTGQYIENITGSNNYLNADILPEVNNFWQYSGSGAFYDNYAKIVTTGDINFNNGTYAMVYEKYSNGGATLISTIETGVDNSMNQYYQGFEFGVTANNRLYFEYYTNSGPVCFSSKNSLSDKASVFLTLENNSISFGSYDFFSRQINSEVFSIQSSYLFNPKNLYIGYNDSSENLYSYNKKFTGYIDNFLFFSPSIYSYEITNLNSGIAHNYNYVSGGITASQTTGVTGFLTGSEVFYTAVTGHLLIPTGVITDIYGNQYSGYQIVEQTGVFSGSTIAPLTGVFTALVTGQSSGYLDFNTGYVSTFGRKRINIIDKLSEQDFVEINLPDKNYPYQYANNILSKYNKIKNNFSTANISKNIDFNVFANGLAQNSGTSYITGDVYNRRLIISNDYAFGNRREVIFSNQFNESDSVNMDAITGIYNSGYYIKDFSYTGTSDITMIDWPVNYHIFFNGQKLTSGNYDQIGTIAHYGITGDSIYFKNIDIFSGTSGILSALPKNFNRTFTGNGNVFTIDETFAQKYSEVYVNGVRQLNNLAYLELANIDTNAGSGIFDIRQQTIYNNII